MTIEEREIKGLTPWSSVTMAQLSLRGVKFELHRSSNDHSWHAKWHREDENFNRSMSDVELWKLVHKVALAWGPNP